MRIIIKKLYIANKNHYHLIVDKREQFLINKLKKDINNMNTNVKISTLSIMLAMCIEPALAATPSIEEKLDLLEQEMQTLKTQLNRSPSLPTDKPSYGTGNTTLGGYGEIVLNNYRDSSKKDEADLKRFVIFLGHKFSDKVRLFSELEVEHAKADKNGGEVAMEQAYIEYGLNHNTNTRAGLMLMPLGITNETHEPPTFYGVERNEVESRIIPSTWRELGFALQGEATAGLEYNVGISTTPDASQYSATNGASKAFRDMRTSGRQAAANDMGVFAALNYRAVPGLLLGASAFSGDTAQDGNGATAKTALVDSNAKLTLWDIHAKFSTGDLEMQALYAQGTLSDTDKINSAAGLAAGSNKAAPKLFSGWYTQAAYHVWKQGDLDVAPFVRYERYNTQQEVDAGFTIDPNNDETVTTIGLNFKLHPQVVMKVDVQNYITDNSKDRLNIGVGYMF